MKIVNVNVPDDDLKQLDNLVANGKYASRTEIIRSLIRDFVKTACQPTSAEA